MQDILGKALLDYYFGNYSEDIITETNISEEDELPLPYLFRDFSEMPSIEQKALDLATGKVLDVGCGAGSHAIYLQNKGLEITAIDLSPGAIEVCKLRGIKDAREQNVLDLKNEKFDTILLLMNGTGIFQKLKYVSEYLTHLKRLLSVNGQILIDSSDLKYMYDSEENGGIWVPQDHYYGELEFTMQYKGEKSEPFPWLYIDEQRFEQLCLAINLTFEIVARGENLDYLAKLSAAADSL
tara:strand:- start:74454 stop:75170 length:717 start_codon:yes stop_codon:yes gene_type:complete